MPFYPSANSNNCADQQRLSCHTFFFQNGTGSSESFRELSAVLEIVKYVYYPHIQSGSGKGWRIRKIYFISKFPCGIIKISFQAGINYINYIYT